MIELTGNKNQDAATKIAAARPSSDQQTARGENLAASSSPSSAQFSRHVLWTLVVRLMQAANSVIAGIIVARWLGAQSFGALSVLNVTVTTSVQIASFGVPAANTYFIGRDARHLAPAAFNSLVFALVVGGAFASGVWLLAQRDPSLLANMPPRLIAVALLSIPFQLATLIGTNIFLVLGRVGRFNLLDLLNQSFGVINACLALIIFHAGLQTLISCNTAASAFVAALIAIWLYRYIESRLNEIDRDNEARWKLDAGLFARMARYSFKGHLLWVSTFLIYRIDLLIVNYFRGAAEAAVYAIASQVAMLLMLLPTVISQLLFSRIATAQDQGGNFTCLVARHTAFLLLIACVASAPISLALPALYGAPFADAPVQLWLLLPGIYCIGLQSVLVQYFVSTGLPRVVPLMWILTLILNIVLNLLIVPSFGPRGAALVSTISYALIFLAVLCYFGARTGNRFAEVLWLRRDELRRLLAMANLSVKF